MKPLTTTLTTGQHTSRESMHFRMWSVRKLRRRPRSRDKMDLTSRNKIPTLKSVKESSQSVSSSEGTNSTESLCSSEKLKKIERDSVSSEDSGNAELRNESTLYNKILSRNSQHNKSQDNDIENTTAFGKNNDENLIEIQDNYNKVNNSGSSDCNLSFKSIDSTITGDICDRSDSKDIGTEKCNKKLITKDSDILLFGCDLPKPMLESSLELSSDQDSTAGEEEEFADEEDIVNLHPDMLLYKAAVAHNLPVMCAALAVGADKLWNNVNDRGRSALHQAIISVSFQKKKKKK